LKQEQLSQEENTKKLLAETEAQQNELVLQSKEVVREKIAGRLHDIVGGMISSIKLNMNIVHDSIETKDDKQKEALEKLEGLMGNLSNEVRQMSHELSPWSIRKFGLKQSLEKLKESFDGSKTIDLELDVSQNIDGLKNYLGINLYRIILEFINNTLKHSGASNAKVSIDVQDQNINLSMSNNGKPFNFNEEENNGRGLITLSEQVTELEGELSFNSDDVITKFSINFPRRAV